MTAMMKLVLPALLACCFLYAQIYAQNSCVQRNSCSCVFSDNKVIDLSPLAFNNGTARWVYNNILYVIKQGLWFVSVSFHQWNSEMTWRVGLYVVKQSWLVNCEFNNLFFFFKKKNQKALYLLYEYFACKVRTQWYFGKI